MVVKQSAGLNGYTKKFESSVILYGSQTCRAIQSKWIWFESSVILYGSQTVCSPYKWLASFESSVILYGSQTFAENPTNIDSLRVV